MQQDEALPQPDERITALEQELKRTQDQLEQSRLRLLELADRMEEEHHQAYVTLEKQIAQRTADLTRTIQQLHEREEGYRLLAEFIPQLIWRTDANGEVIECNQHWYDYTGQTAEEARGWGWMSALHPDDLPRVANKVQQELTGREFFETEYRLRRASDNSYRWHLVRAVPKRNDNGEVTAWFGSATDIEDQKRTEEALRESEVRFHTLAELAPIGIFLGDADGNVTYVNPRWSIITGWSAEHGMGLNWMEGIHPDDRAYVQRERTIISRDQQEVLLEYRYLTPARSGTSTPSSFSTAST